jgi:hypothetical protein
MSQNELVQTSLMNQFLLDDDYTKLLFSLESFIIRNDIRKNGNENKKKWYFEWTKTIRNYLSEKDKDFTELLYYEQAIKPLITKKQKKTPNKIPLYLIGLELVTFTPYYPLSKDDKISESYKKDKDYLKYLFKQLDISPEYVDKFEETYNDSIKSLSGYWTKLLAWGLGGALLLAVTGGLLAPYIAGMIGASAGLYGAAAVSYGLATLGGGAVAAGGLGMSGGLAVIVGGGALIGGSVGTGFGKLVSGSSNFTLSQAAKLETIAKEIIIGQQQDIRYVQKIIDQITDNKASLEKKLTKLKLEDDKNKQQIKEMEKSIEYLEKLVNNLTKEIK